MNTPLYRANCKAGRVQTPGTIFEEVMRVAFGTSYENPVAETDSTGISHVYPMGQEHEFHPACWCFPVRQTHDSKGNRMKREVFVHRDFCKRGNA